MEPPLIHRLLQAPSTTSRSLFLYLKHIFISPPKIFLLTRLVEMDIVSFRGEGGGGLFNLENL